MKVVWYLRGKPGFERVSDEEAESLVDSGNAQIADGKVTLKPFDSTPLPVKKRRGRPPKYPNKMLVSE